MYAAVSLIQCGYSDVSNNRETDKLHFSRVRTNTRQQQMQVVNIVSFCRSWPISTSSKQTHFVNLHNNMAHRDSIVESTII